MSDIHYPPKNLLSAFNLLPGAYLLLSTELIIEAVTDAYLEATLTRRENLIGRPMLEVFPDNPQTPEANAVHNLRSSLEQVLATGKPHEMARQRYDVPDPENPGQFVERHWLPQNTPVLDDQGQIQGIIHAAVNITESVQADKLLRESQAREQATLTDAELQREQLQNILMQAPASICIFEGPQHVFKLANPPYQQLVGGRPLLGRPIAEAMPELIGQPIIGWLDEVYRTGKSFYAHETLVQLDHQNSGKLGQNYYNFIYQATRNLAGEINGIMVFAYEVTAQVQARQQVQDLYEELQAANEELQDSNEEVYNINSELLRTQKELQQLNEKLEALVADRTNALQAALHKTEQQREQLWEQQSLLGQILGQVPAAIATLTGPEHRFNYFNDAYQALSGNRTQLGKTVAEVFPEVVEQGFINLMDQVYATGEPFIGVEMPAQLYDATTGRSEQRYVDFIYQPLRNGQSQIQGILVFIVDVTDKVKTRRYADDLKAELLVNAQEMAQKRETFYQVFEQTPASIALLRGPEHRFEYVNLSYQQLFPGRSLLGFSIAEALPETIAFGFVSLLNQVYQTGEAFFGTELPLQIVAADGSLLPEAYFTFTYQAYRENGAIVGVSIFAFDVTEQVLARREADRQRQQLHTLFMEAPAPIVILSGPSLVYELVNPAYQQIFPGRTLLGKKLLEALPEVAGTPIVNILNHVYQTGETFVAQEMPLLLARYEGGPLEEIYWTFTYQARRNGQGIVDGVMAFAHEVTDQVVARKAIEANAQQLKLITDALPVLIGYLDQEEKYRFANQAYEAWFNQKPEDLLGRSVREVVGEKAYQGVKQYIDRALAGERLDFEAVMPYREDFKKYIRTSYVPDIREGDIVGFYTMVNDITEQVEARQEIARSAAELQVVAANAPMFIFRVSTAGDVTYVNESLFEWSGLKLDPTQLNEVWSLIHPDERPAVKKSFDASLRANQPWESPVYRIRRRDGEYRWSITRTQPYFNTDGRLAGYSGVNVEIHEQIELQQQLTRVNIDLDNFIYTASHDLKAPILNIEGLTEALLDQLAPESLQSEQVQHIFGLISNSVQRFKRTIDHLTEITKLQKENSTDTSLVNVATVINDVQLDLVPLIKSTKADLKVDVTHCPTIRFSEKNLRSVIYNLLSNALKYHSPERLPVVQVRCHQTTEYQVLTVQDNGLGIDLTEQNKLFAMFRRLHTHVEGTGIGLYMVKRILENAGGKIEVESKIGEGSIFRVYFRLNF